MSFFVKKRFWRWAAMEDDAGAIGFNPVRVPPSPPPQVPSSCRRGKQVRFTSDSVDRMCSGSPSSP